MISTRTLMFGACLLIAETALAERPPAPNSVGEKTGQGSIDKEVIRRVVRAHIHEVRRCYERALEKKPALRGRVTVNWRIEPDGSVSSAKVQNSTLLDDQTEQCIVASVGTWTFPKPVGGWVSITYPFALESAGGSEAPPAETTNKADPLRSR